MAASLPESSYKMTRPDEVVSFTQNNPSLLCLDYNKILTPATSQDEAQRLDLQHQIFLLTLHDRLSTIALPAHVPNQHILDIGTGTGAWAHAIALAHPAAHVTAIDLTPPLPSSSTQPPNLRFLRADVEEAWDPFTQQQKYTLIHGRMLASGIHDWARLLRRCYENLQPGTGWLELLDLCHPFRSAAAAGAAEEEEEDAEASEFIRWGRVAERGWKREGLDYRAGERHVDRLTGLGFVDVGEVEMRWPLGGWMVQEEEGGGERQRKIGEMMLGNFGRFLSGAGVAIVEKDPGLGRKGAERLVERAERDLRENWGRRKFYLTM